MTIAPRSVPLFSLSSPLTRCLATSSSTHSQTPILHPSATMEIADRFRYLPMQFTFKTATMSDFGPIMDLAARFTEEEPLLVSTGATFPKIKGLLEWLVETCLVQDQRLNLNVIATQGGVVGSKADAAWAAFPEEKIMGYMPMGSTAPEFRRPGLAFCTFNLGLDNVKLAETGARRMGADTSGVKVKAMYERAGYATVMDFPKSMKKEDGTSVDLVEGGGRVVSKTFDSPFVNVHPLWEEWGLAGPLQ